MSEQKTITETTVQEPIDDAIKQEHPAETKKKKNLFSALGNFAKSRQTFLVCLGGIIMICAVILSAITAIHAIQAKEIINAQAGKCYISKQGDYTEIFAFTEDHYSYLRIDYEYGDHVSNVFGSLDNALPLKIKISLFGEIRLDYRDIEVNDQNIIVSARGYTWEPFSLDDALVLQEKSLQMEKFYSACNNAAIGTTGFLSRINKSLTYTATKFKEFPSDEDLITAAKSLLSEKLKNPSTAIYNVEKVVETDDYGRGIVYLDVSAQNSFGGYVRSKYYICIKGISSSGNYYNYNPIFYSVENTYLLDSLKESNDWNKDRSENDGLSDFKPGDSVKTSTLKVNGITLERHEFSSTNVRYTAYIEPVSQYVLAVEISIPTYTFSQLNDSEKDLLAKAISGTMDGVDKYASGWTTVFDTEGGLLSKSPYFGKEYCYHAAEKNGQYYISLTNFKALGCDEINYWTPVK